MINLDDTLFNINIDRPALPARGNLLVAEPMMDDMYFNHAVITIIDYEEGRKSMGLVMNRPTNLTLGQMVEGFADDVDLPIYVGGPVDANRMFYMHRLGPMIDGSLEITPGLWIGGDYGQMKQYISDGMPTDGLVRFFIGYSGWDENQLENELRMNSWTVSPPLRPRQMLTNDSDAYWHKVVRSMGAPYRNWLMHPMFPSAN